MGFKKWPMWPMLSTWLTWHFFTTSQILNSDLNFVFPFSSQQVTIVMPSERFLVPRDSLSRYPNKYSPIWPGIHRLSHILCSYPIHPYSFPYHVYHMSYLSWSITYHHIMCVGLSIVPHHTISSPGLSPGMWTGARWWKLWHKSNW